MRKQTKVVAVASAAALLAIGGAMTSFAAQGWVEEDGTWYYYDKDGNRVEDEWKKYGQSGFFRMGRGQRYPFFRQTVFLVFPKRNLKTVQNLGQLHCHRAERPANRLHPKYGFCE